MTLTFRCRFRATLFPTANHLLHLASAGLVLSELSQPRRRCTLGFEECYSRKHHSLSTIFRMNTVTFPLRLALAHIIHCNTEDRLAFILEVCTAERFLGPPHQ